MFGRKTTRAALACALGLTLGLAAAPAHAADAIKIAESAVLTPADVAHYRADGADVVLVGEALVTSDPVSTLHAFLEAGE